jgi:hypothetical protein
MIAAIYGRKSNPQEGAAGSEEPEPGAVKGRGA